MLVRISLSSLFFILMGCGSNSSNNSVPTPRDPEPVLTPVVIEGGMEDGDLTGIRLSIQGTKETDSTTTYKLVSSYEGKPIGLMLVLPGKDKRKKAGSRAFFKSLGPPSDLFLHVLARQYRQHVDSLAKFADSISFICMNLENFFSENSDSTQGNNRIAAEYKLFFDSESMDGDAEMFMNMNPDRQWVEFVEKDEDYRRHLIKLFRQHY